MYFLPNIHHQSWSTSFQTHLIFLFLNTLNLFSFITQERQLATDVVNILEASKAVDYIPVFARHRMTPELILDMKDEELRQVRAPM